MISRLPLLSVTLAQRTHAPNLTMVVEGGVIGCEVLPGRLPISTNEMRLAHRANVLAHALGFDARPTAHPWNPLSTTGASRVLHGFFVLGWLFVLALPLFAA